MCIITAPALLGASSATVAAVTNASLISLATTAYGQYQAKQGYDLQERTAEINREAAIQDASESYKSLSERELQEREATEAAITSVQEQANRNAALSATSAGEAGVSGNVAAAVANDIRRQGLTETGRAKRSLEFTESQIDAERGATFRRAEGRVAGTQLGPSPVDYFGAALNVGAGAFSTLTAIQVANGS